MTTTTHLKRLLLLGAGHAHVHVISTLAIRGGLEGVEITLVAPYSRQLYSGMVPGYVAGHYTLDDCVIPLEPLLKNGAIRWLRHRAVAIDPDARHITLEDGSVHGFDWLSVNTGPVQNRDQIEQAMPGARMHGLFVRPIESFGALWPQVVDLAQSRALRMAILGGGAAGIELAMAVRQRLPDASVTLLTGGTEVAANYPSSVQQKVTRALKRRNITVLADRAVGITATEVTLAGGARLACDVPLIATGAQAPVWLASSSLALDANGFITVDAFQRSTSHSHVFAAGDVSSRVDRELARSGVYAVRAGRALTKNLVAAVTGVPLTPHQPPKNTLNLLSCGNRRAIASWGSFAAEGRWVWWLKDWIDRGFIKRYRED
jgi:pyridine nucleotide-disulfide oxidoreductase family protein